MKTSLPHSRAYCRIGISKLHGVGLIAIVDIPKGTVLFTGKDEPAESVPKSVVDALPLEQQKLYNDFGVLLDGNYVCPSDFSTLSVGWYFNDSCKPNVITKKFYHHGLDFVTIKDIKVGDELCLNYSEYEKVFLDLELKRFPPNRKSSRKK